MHLRASQRRVNFGGGRSESTEGRANEPKTEHSKLSELKLLPQRERGLDDSIGS